MLRHRDAELESARWAAVTSRDRNADGSFVFAVKTTGIYCRPSCPARRAHRANVVFFATADAARRAGFRPCQRCSPDTSAPGRHHAAIAAACKSIETAEHEPKLKELARHAGLSPFHFQRLFKSAVGLTPKAYAQAHRRARLADALQRSATVTEAIYEAGYQSNGRFYQAAAETVGMTPREFRTGAPGVRLTYTTGRSALGHVLVATSSTGIAAILLGDNNNDLLEDLGARFPNSDLVAGTADEQQMLARVIQHIERPDRAVDLPLDIRGTAFQHQVWAALRAIQPGTTASYTEIAERIGRPKAARAVAAACAANAHAILIPCHRVVRADGDVSGYRWGVKRKRALLEREAAAQKTLPLVKK